MTYVIPHLEFAVAAWNPYLKQDISTLEKVQQRATKMSSAIKTKNYEERLKFLGLKTLKDRRERGDLIQKFKIENGYDIINWCNLPQTLSQRINRRTQYKRGITKKLCPKI
jgi:hypothetical protein